MLKNTSLIKDVILKHGGSDNNSGNSSVQIALLTLKINYLQKHFILHRNDHCGRKGLLKLVSRRRKLLDYIKSNQREHYLFLIKELNLRY
ncbi:30S ribosomal protein S15 [Buchnera aphidicola (Cinara cuneomaculata)]|uniref:Small ribosomal subunit protein uS15 n=1 Tax=Buchnera aphidicola (Cinara cuneomaculata) TaxID=1660040 RepID=A0A451CXW3_9GAMM|nr:30S ribosomal protein S15 [Buchnera aphidicola]VFP78224.1 30S ribosomal protein S15 [Buchnera aphidicola (Cinara cuneomaculata)]